MDQPTDPTTVPSVSTGVYDLPEDRRDRILAYGRALFEAKAAGVAGADPPMAALVGAAEPCSKLTVKSA